MTETKAFVTIDNTDADADAAYDRVLPESQALASEKLVPINIDVSAALITAMGVAERLPGLQQDLQSVSPALAATASKYADYVLALFSAQSRFAMATTPPAQLPELLAEATKWRDLLLADARALGVRGQLNTEPLNELSGSHGYKNVAFDLTNLTRAFKTSWASIEGKTQLTMSELQEADRVSLKLTAALAHRALSPEQVAAATDIRQRVFTLFYDLYDEIRRAVSFLRWHHEDADSIIPSLYAGRGVCWLLCQSASSRGHLIIVMESRKYGHRIELGAFAIALARAWNGDSRLNPLMRATSIEIAQSKFFENPPQVASPENDDVIQAFTPDTAKESFTDRVHQWCTNRSAQYFHACAFCNAIEFRSKLVVIIANDELGSFAERRNVPKLLRCPFLGWRSSDANGHNSPRIDIDDEEREDWSKPNIVRLQEIAGPHRGFLRNVRQVWPRGSSRCWMMLANTSPISLKLAGSSRLVLDANLNDHAAEDQCSHDSHPDGMKGVSAASAERSSDEHLDPFALGQREFAKQMANERIFVDVGPLQLWEMLPSSCQEPGHQGRTHDCAITLAKSMPRT